MPSAFHLGIGLLAGSLLAFELLLLRLFKLAHGSEFPTIAIALALLGFGASGTLLSLARGWSRRHARAIAVASGPLAGGAMLGVFFLSQAIPFRPEFLVWGGVYVRDLILWTLPLAMPFLIGALGLGVVFLRWPRQTRSLYAANLIGSGVGAAALYGALYLVRPEDGILLTASLATLAGALMALRWRGLVALGCALVFVAGVGVMGQAHMPEIRLSDTRALSLLRQLPDARTVETRFGPEGRVDVIASEAFHHRPGQGLGSPSLDFAETAICLDGDLAGALIDERMVNAEDGEILDFLSRVPWMAARFDSSRFPSQSVLLLGADSELSVMRAAGVSPDDLGHHLRWMGSDSVTLTNSNSLVLGALREGLPPAHVSLNLMSGGSQPSRIHFNAVDGLSHLRQSQDLFQLIFHISAPGSAADPNPLYTVQGVTAALDRLQKDGRLTLAAPIEAPGRASLRLITLAAHALNERSGSNAHEHLMSLRGFSQIALILAPDPLPARDLLALRQQCHRFGPFDPVWTPDISPDEVNRFNVLDEPIYHETARRIFAGEAEEVYAEYPFELRPPTEWWPFFWQPFKPATLWGMLIGRHPAGLETIPEANAVLALIHSLRAVTVAGAALILLPLLWLRQRADDARQAVSSVHVFLLFAALGFGYLTLEVLMIQQAQRVVGRPVLAATLTVATFLVASGLGSLIARPRRGLFAAILILTLAAVAATEWLARSGQGSMTVRATIAALAMTPLAFAMGMPFPLALRAVSLRAPALVPWAWGVNGFLSVLAGPLATFLALTGGYQAVLAVGLVSYAVAGWVHSSVDSRGNREKGPAAA